MSIEHFAAAFRCRKFKGGARLLLLALANRASDGKPSKTGKLKHLYGWSFAGTAMLMMDIGASTRDTVIDNMKALVDAGVVKRQRRLSHSSLTFVDIQVLRSLAYTEEDIAAFRKKADSKVGKSTTSGQSDGEKAPPPKSGNSTTTVVGKTTSTDVGEIPVAVSGNSPTDNPKHQPTGSNTTVGKPSVSESELTDAESEDRSHTTTFRDNSVGQEEDICALYEEEHLTDYIPVSARAVVPPAPTPNEPESESESESKPEQQLYAATVHLCSLFWATHSLPEAGKDPGPEPPPEHPWGHPRTWKPWQRRDCFISSVNPELRLKSEWKKAIPNRRAGLSDAEPDEEGPRFAPDPAAAEEQAYLADEAHMLALYLENGREAVEKVLRWIPASRWFHNPDAELITIADLRRKWKYVSAECEKYHAKASESGTEDQRDKWIAANFVAAGGRDAEIICYERLNPISLEDAAEEQAMDAYDDVYGADFFDVWAEHDCDDATGAPPSQNAGDALFNPWSDSDEDDGGPAGLHATLSTEEDDAAERVARYCDACGSRHAGMCPLSDCFDLE